MSGHIGEYTVRRLRADLYTVHAPTHSATYGRILATARSAEEAEEIRARHAGRAKNRPTDKTREPTTDQ